MRKTLSSERVVKGYIEAFDPDVLVQCIPQLPKYIENFGLEVTKPSEIWQPLVGEKEYGPNYGIGIMEDMQEYVKGLDIKRDPIDPSKGPQFSLQHWYPRIWDDWARDKDGAEADDIYHEEKRLDINEPGDKLTVQIKPLQPQFRFEFAGHGTARVANEISCSLFGTIEALAQIFPKSHGNHLLRTIGDITAMRGEWRVGRNGLVKLVRNDFTDRWDVPKAEDTLFAWLKDQGWNPDGGVCAVSSK